MTGLNLQISFLWLGLLVVLIVDVAIILRVLTSHALVSAKLLWIALVVLLPVIGAGLWWFYGPSQLKAKDES